MLLVEVVERRSNVADINAGSHGACIDSEPWSGLVLGDQAFAQEFVDGLAQALTGLSASLFDRLLDVWLEVDRCPHVTDYAS